MSKEKVPYETAKDEFEYWLTQQRRIDIEDIDEDKDAKESKETIIKHITRGNITIDGGFITYYPRETVNGELSEIRFPPRILLDDMAVQDRFKDTETTARTKALIGKMTGKNSGIIGKMDGADVTIAGNILRFYFL